MWFLACSDLAQHFLDMGYKICFDQISVVSKSLHCFPIKVTAAIELKRLHFPVFGGRPLQLRRRVLTDSLHCTVVRHTSTEQYSLVRGLSSLPWLTVELPWLPDTLHPLGGFCPTHLLILKMSPTIVGKHWVAYNICCAFICRKYDGHHPETLIIKILCMTPSLFLLIMLIRRLR